jgi:predicted N-acetyltransferase YhbS
MTENRNIVIPERIGDGPEIDYGKAGHDFAALGRDRIPIRAMQDGDLHALIAIDRRITGRERSAYFVRKLEEALYESGVRVSLVAEQDGAVVGFIMARVDLGEFGRTEAVAVMDTIGVDPGYRQRGVAQALLSQLLVNLATLRVERIRTEVDWNARELLAYLGRCGFRPSQQLCFEYALRG